MILSYSDDRPLLKKVFDFGKVVYGSVHKMRIILYLYNLI